MDLEGAWTTEPAKWDNNFFDNLFNYEWELVKGSGGAWQWTPKDDAAKDTVPDAHDPAKRHAPMMLTTDLALRLDPAYEPISRRFRENPAEFAEAFAKAWYKLTHRDMGPITCCLGPEVPAEPLLWQDPVPSVDHDLIDDADATSLKAKILGAGLTIPQLVKTAWSSAATFRGTDKRGGANGARIRLAPQKDWAVNQSPGAGNGPDEPRNHPERLQRFAVRWQEGLSRRPDRAWRHRGGRKSSEESWTHRSGSLLPRRTDATQEQTDVESFAALEPRADGFRNYLQPGGSQPAEELLVDRAQMLSLTAPEMTVLVGGLRALNANAGKSKHGVLTDRPETLTTDFFVNLLDMSTEWHEDGSDQEFKAVDRESGETKWTGTRADLVFGSNSQLRAIAEVYASDDSQERFVSDFVAAWAKVMELGSLRSLLERPTSQVRIGLVTAIVHQADPLGRASAPSSLR